MVLLSFGSADALTPTRVKQYLQSSIFGLPSYDGPNENLGTLWPPVTGTATAPPTSRWGFRSKTSAAPTAAAWRC